MSNNLLELLKEHLSGDVVSNLASFMGEPPKNTESALHTAIPSLLAGLVDKSADSNSLGSLFKLLTEGNHDGGVLSNLGALSRGGDETTHLLSDGSKLLSSIFGDKSAGIADLVANASGISKASSSSLLSFVTPIVMGLIGKTLKIGHMETAAGLANLLSSQSGFLKDFIPAGLSSLLAGGSLSAAIHKADDLSSVGTAATTGHAISDFDKAVSTLDSGDMPPSPAPTFSATEALGNIGGTIEDMAGETFTSAKNVVEDFGESAGKFGSHIVDEGKEFAHSAADAFEADGGGKKILPWILIAAALALVWGLLKSCSAPETPTPVVTTLPTTPPPAGSVVTAPPQPAITAPSTSEPPKTEAPAADIASNFFEKTLSTGYAIKAAKEGLESKLVGFIEGNEAISKDLWFNMDGILFDTNKATIKAESKAQINHVAEILKAYPEVKIKIGGYTDNTGKADANIRLSGSRANAVKKALVSKGIKANRLDAEGYGSEHPVASNDTAEGRQKNRRIDVRVTKK